MKSAYSVSTVSSILADLEPMLRPDVQKIELLGLKRGRLQLRFHGSGSERFTGDEEMSGAIEAVFRDNMIGVEAVDITAAADSAGLGIAQSGEPLTKVDRSTNLGHLAAVSPAAAVILTDWGLHCVGCMASAYDTVETGAKLHGMTDDEINRMIAEVNEVLKGKQSA